MRPSLLYIGSTSDENLLGCLASDRVSFDGWMGARLTMSGQAPNSPVADQAPDADVLTAYDREHVATYLRLLDADAQGADWTEVARIVLDIDPAREPERARRAWESHLSRAKWMTKRGYEHLLRSP